MGHGSDCRVAAGRGARIGERLGQLDLLAGAAGSLEARRVSSAARSRSRWREGGPNFREPDDGFDVEPAVAAALSKAALKGHERGRLRLRSHAIPDGGEVVERLGGIDGETPRGWACGWPDPDAGAGEPGPVEQLAGIALALRRNIRMGDYPMRRDRIDGDQVSAQTVDRRHLRLAA